MGGNAAFAADIVSRKPGGADKREALLASVPSLVEEIARDAARRDLETELPFKAFELFRESGLGALRIPEHLGGPGGSVLDYIEMIAAIGSADSNVAHALRSHFNFTEGLRLAPDLPRAREHLEKVLTGHLFGGAHTELGTARPGEITTLLSRTPAGLRLNGRKWYATGTAFADYATFSARTEDEQFVSVMIPVGRAGVTILDDWDGMGQRLTASGGVLLEDVEVLEHEIVPRALDGLIGRHTSTLRQLHLAASACGAVRAVLREGVDYVRTSARSAAHSDAPTARTDQFVQKVVGEIAARSFAVDLTIHESARALDRTVEAFSNGDPDKLEAALIEAAVITAQAQLVSGELALKAAEQIFELGGGTATSRTRNFDRHWRNIRTVLSHNPLQHKARVLGDFYLNGTTTHLKEGRVF